MEFDYLQDRTPFGRELHHVPDLGFVNALKEDHVDLHRVEACLQSGFQPFDNLRE